MNVFLLLLCVAIIISLLISNRLVQPLKQLQLKVKQIQFSNRNQHIQYTNRDEIGEIVSAYNGKLDELELAIKQLKANERESAWRDVAKQVAHEIKNPLTPIKLSVQHLLRLYDPSNPASQEKLQSVVQSIIEQIDALTKITNDFSNFAQVPQPVKQNVDIILLTRSCVSVLELTEKIEFIIKTELKTHLVLIDKEQWIQVLNNLLKNATQACAGLENAKVTIRIKDIKKGFTLEITDTGCGMSADKLSKVFTPYFTTKSSGSGIGLSIVKQIVENHGGQIICDSKEGAGSTFVVTVA
jgi:nitrogen fixation/metabolism regulation signal transduction histidine kinase